MSLAAGRINFLPVVKDFLALAMQLATKNDVLSVGALDEIVLLEKAMQTHSSTLGWKILWTEEPGRLQPMGS